MRSFAAVVLGYLVSAVLVVLAHAVTSVPAILILVGLLAAIAGGWVAGAIGRTAPMRHAAALAGFMFLMGLVSLAAPAQGAEATAAPPAWWLPVVIATGIAGSLAGGWIRARA